MSVKRNCQVPRSPSRDCQYHDPETAMAAGNPCSRKVDWMSQAEKTDIDPTMRGYSIRLQQTHTACSNIVWLAVLASGESRSLIPDSANICKPTLAVSSPSQKLGVTPPVFDQRPINAADAIPALAQNSHRMRPGKFHKLLSSGNKMKQALAVSLVYSENN